MSVALIQHLLRRLSTPLRMLFSAYAALLLVFTVLRFTSLAGMWWLDLANAFAPFWYLPLIITFPISVVVTRKMGKEQPPRWSVALQIFLIGVAVVWFAVPTVHAPVDPPTGKTFKAITYNVLGHNKDLSPANDWLLAQNADIIILQETGDPYDSRLLPLYQVYPHEAHIDGNVRIFSRYDILQKELIPTEEYPGHLTLKVVVDQDGRELAVYATHFVLPYTDKAHLPILKNAGFPLSFALHYDETRRNAQIRRLINVLKQEPLPYILAGDFNTSDHSMIYNEIAAIMTDSFREAGTGVGRTWPVAKVIGAPPFLPPLIRIDYVWHSEDLRATSAFVGTQPIGSDHLPVVVTLTWVE